MSNLRSVSSRQVKSLPPTSDLTICQQEQISRPNPPASTAHPQIRRGPSWTRTVYCKEDDSFCPIFAARQRRNGYRADRRNRNSSCVQSKQYNRQFSHPDGPATSWHSSLPVQPSSVDRPLPVRSNHESVWYERPQGTHVRSESRYNISTSNIFSSLQGNF